MDWVPLLCVTINFTVYGSVFPICWKIRYARHPPRDAEDEVWNLAFVCLSMLFVAVTSSAVIGKIFGSTVAGGYFFYSTILGTLLAVLATSMVLYGGRSNRNPRGLERTMFLGLISGGVILVAINVTVFLSLVPSL